jgi:hypothetical protein
MNAEEATARSRRRLSGANSGEAVVEERGPARPMSREQGANQADRQNKHDYRKQEPIHFDCFIVASIRVVASYVTGRPGAAPSWLP